MTDTQRTPQAFPIVKASLALTAVVLGVALCFYAVLTGFGQTAHAQDAMTGAFVSLVIGLSGFVPVWLMSRRSAYGSAYGFLVSILVRCVVGFAAVAWLRWGIGALETQNTLMWVAGWYLLVLGVEVKLISSHVLAVTGTTGPIPETN